MNNGEQGILITPEMSEACETLREFLNSRLQIYEAFPEQDVNIATLGDWNYNGPTARLFELAVKAAAVVNVEFVEPLVRMQHNPLPRKKEPEAIREVLEILAEIKIKFEGQKILAAIVGSQAHGAKGESRKMESDANDCPDENDLSDVETSTKQWNEKLMALTLAPRKAYWSWRYAQSKKGVKVTDTDAYHWLRNQGRLDDEAGFRQLGFGYVNELDGYEVQLEFDAWYKQLNIARRALDEKKYQSRSRRPTGQSIVNAGDIEYRKNGDE